MTSQNDSAGARDPAASRRDFVTAVTAVAAASAATGSAQAQAGTSVRHSNPSGLTQPTAYSQLVEVNGPHRFVFVAGQTGVDASGKPRRDSARRRCRRSRTSRPHLLRSGAAWTTL
jgi:hypothetical protein